MGSQRSTSPNPNDALDPVDVSRRRGVDVNSDSKDSTESAESKESKLLTFIPKTGVQAPLFSDETANLESENNLDFRPEAGGQRRSSGILRSETVPYIDQSGANPTFFLLKESESNDQPAPEIEIVQGTSLQISDESGNIIADASDRTSGSRINRDLTTGNITSITYPDGKERNFTYTDQRTARFPKLAWLKRMVNGSPT